MSTTTPPNPPVSTPTPNTSPGTWTVTAYALFDQGHRADQEDRHDLRVLAGKMRFVIVCDGAGGPPAGEDAAEIGITVIGGACRATDFAAGTDPRVVRKFMEDLFVAADKQVKEEGITYPEKNGLGAACVMMLEVPPDFHFLGAGDARGYTYDGKTLSRRTSDQTGYLPNSITSALGWLDAMSYQNKPVDEVFPGDWGVIILCSDGLTKNLSDPEIAQVLTLKQGGTAKEICEKLMADAKASDRSHDNITVVVLVYVRVVPK